MEDRSGGTEGVTDLKIEEGGAGTRKQRCQKISTELWEGLGARGKKKKAEGGGLEPPEDPTAKKTGLRTKVH